MIPQHIPEYLHDAYRQVADEVGWDAPQVALEAMARELWLMRDAESRLVREGAVVVDAKGNAGEHPAIKIQRDAGKALRDWMESLRRERSRPQMPGF